MPQSLSAVHVHIVFSTKGRRPFLRDRDKRIELHKYLGGISKHLDCPALAIGGVADHVHLLVRLGRSMSQAELVKELKRASNLWLKHCRNPVGVEWNPCALVTQRSPPPADNVGLETKPLRGRRRIKPAQTRYAVHRHRAVVDPRGRRVWPSARSGDGAACVADVNAAVIKVSKENGTAERPCHDEATAFASSINSRAHSRRRTIAGRSC